MDRRKERMQPAVVEHFERQAYTRGAVAVYEVEEGEVCDEAAVVFFDGKAAAVCEGWRIDNNSLAEGKAFAYVPRNRVYGMPEEGEVCLVVVVVGFDDGDTQHPEAVSLLQEITQSPVASFTLEGNTRGYACAAAFNGEMPATIYRAFYSWNYLISVEIISLDNF